MMFSYAATQRKKRAQTVARSRTMNKSPSSRLQTASTRLATGALSKMKYVNSQFQFYQTLTSAGSMLLLSQFGSDVTFLTSLKEDDEKSL